MARACWETYSHFISFPEFISVLIELLGFSRPIVKANLNLRFGFGDIDLNRNLHHWKDLVLNAPRLKPSALRIFSARSNSRLSQILFFLAKLCTDKVACQKQVAGTTLLQQSVDKRRFTLTIPNRKRSQEFSNVESFNMILYDSYGSVGLHDSRRLYLWSTSALRFGSKSLRNLHPHSPVAYSLQQDAQFSRDSHGIHMRFHIFSCLSLSVHWSYLKTIENLFDLIRFWVLSLLRLCP